MIQRVFLFVMLAFSLFSFAACSAQPTDEDFNDPQKGVEIWKKVVPEVLKITKAEVVIPLWGMSGNKLYIVNTKTDINDTDALKEAAEDVLAMLRKKTKLFDGPYKVLYMKAEEGQRTPEEMTELTRFEIP